MKWNSFCILLKPPLQDKNDIWQSDKFTPWEKEKYNTILNLNGKDHLDIEGERLLSSCLEMLTVQKPSPWMLLGEWLCVCVCVCVWERERNSPLPSFPLCTEKWTPFLFLCTLFPSLDKPADWPLLSNYGKVNAISSTQINSDHVLHSTSLAQSPAHNSGDIIDLQIWMSWGLSLVITYVPRQH